MSDSSLSLDETTDEILDEDAVLGVSIIIWHMLKIVIINSCTQFSSGGCNYNCFNCF